MWTVQEDDDLRREAMQWLAARTNDGSGSIPWDELTQDFFFHGQRQPLKDRMAGIYKPRKAVAALSITTAFRREGRDRPYDDGPGPDEYLRYMWRGDDPMHSDNRALRAAMEQRLPLIWFIGIAQGIYTPIFPVYLIDEDETRQQFVVSADPTQNIGSTEQNEGLRRYRYQLTKTRLHQPLFRSKVMLAYRTQCAVCALRHNSLLDAAHIVGDSEEGGIAAVRNGMALCKIHHAAYDAGILGVSPDLQVAIREDILEEVDGPVLEYGLKRLHGHKLRVVPSSRAEKPDRDLLGQHFEKFRTAKRPAPFRYDVGM